MRCRSSFPLGFTLTELLVVIAITGTLVMLLLPAVQAVRETVRRVDCGNRQRQLVQGALHHADARAGVLPVGSHNSEWKTWAVSLLPFLEHADLHSRYDGRLYLPETRFNAGGNAVVSATPLPLFSCPSDGWARVRMDGNPVAHNFVGCSGNALYEATAAGWFTAPPTGKDWIRFGGPSVTTTNPAGEGPGSWSRQSTPAGFKGGCFIMSGGDENLVPEESPALRRPAKAVRLTEIAKGQARTVAFSEVIRQPSGNSDGTEDRRGLTMWGPGSLFTTQRRPNTSEPDLMPWPGDCGAQSGTEEIRPPCAAPHYQGEPYAMAARSRHPGGVVVAFCDGHVCFVTDSIGTVEWANMGTIQADVAIR
jgi:prepilin-type N-terminal cleavage/methylation domain-containing protein/prepilin-type processing-associated H-X9-DG protein